jgi:hypothetical protein
MQTYSPNLAPSRIYTSQAPHIVGQEVLLEYAIDDFLRRTTRLKPWYKARYEFLLNDMNVHFDHLLRRPAPLAAFSNILVDHWLDTQYPNIVAEQMLAEFQQYLSDWGWVKSNQ